MPIRDQAAQEASLDNDYGPTRGPNAPDVFEVALFAGDPEIDGVEVPSNVAGVGTGYARATLSNDDWLPAEGRMKESFAVQFPEVADEWPDTVTHAALRDPVAGAWWDVVPLSEPLDITAAGPGPSVVLVIFHDNTLD